MMDVIKNIIREELEGVISKKFSEGDVLDAIKNKHFIHTRDGVVYSPVVLKKNFFTGVDADNRHANISLDEITLIQSKEDRFKNT